MYEENRPIFKVKKDCFAYSKDLDDCVVLTDLYCKKENCSFYKTKEQYKNGLGNYKNYFDVEE